MSHEYCVYLLTSGTSRPGTYKGCTNNLRRRVRQHNGEIKGGARSTTRRRQCHPWKVACVASNLTHKEALRLEWSWKHPHGPRSYVRGPFAEQVAHLRSCLARLGLTHAVVCVGPFDHYLSVARCQNPSHAQSCVQSESGIAGAGRPGEQAPSSPVVEALAQSSPTEGSGTGLGESDRDPTGVECAHPQPLGHDKSTNHGGVPGP